MRSLNGTLQIAKADNETALKQEVGVACDVGSSMLMPSHMRKGLVCIMCEISACDLAKC